MDETAVAVAVEETAALLRGDGADLRLVSADNKTARIRLALDLDDVTCADCVLPPDLLLEMLTAALNKRVPGEFEVVLDDPRTAPAP